MVCTDDRITEFIERNLKKTRLAHTYAVADEAVKLAERYGEDPARARTAALFHDMCRNMPVDTLNGYIDTLGLSERLRDNVNLLHGKAAAAMMASDFGVTDDDMINAVAFHTTGRRGMSLLEKIIFLADAIEPGRDYPSVDETRRLAYRDIDEACINSLSRTVEYVREKGDYLDPDTLDALEYLKEKRKHDRT